MLALNAPVYLYKPLQQQLRYVLDSFKKGDLSGALEALNIFDASLLHPCGVVKKRALLTFPEVQKDMAIERMTRGFQFPLKMDARNEIIKYARKFLALVGEKSQLATVDNQTSSHYRNHEYKIVSDADTHLWDDNPAMTNTILYKWMNGL